jgi:putative ABC transport system ATP-binding protein
MGADDRPHTGGGLLRRAVRRHRGRLLAGMALLSGHQVAEALVPVMIGVIIDNAVATMDLPVLLLLLGVLAALFTSLTICWRFGARHVVTAMQREMHQLRLEVVDRALDPRGQRTARRTGELLQVATSDAERAATVLQATSLIAASATALAVSAVSLLTIDVPLGLAVLLGVPVLVAGLQLLGPPLTRRTADAQAAAGDTTALATDLVRGVRALRGIGAQDSAARMYAGSSQHALTASLRAATTNGVYQGITAAVSGLFLAAVAGFAGWLALDGDISIGELITVVGLAQFVAEPVRMLGMCGQFVARARASAGRIVDVLATPHATAAPAEPREPVGPAEIRLSGVGYRTLRGLSLHAAGGEIVGVVGYDPADCDALLAVLAGTAADHDGSVTVAGVPAESLDLDTRRRVVLVEPHDVALFEETLRDNLTAGGDHDDDAVTAAVAAAAADDIVATRPEGLDHPVADRGTSLSGGQRQRVGLARALLADPPVLVLHDPTTAVDAVTEERIARGIADRRAGAVTLLVTTSPALLAVTDRVVVIEGGTVTATGTHPELSTTDTRYQEAVLR